MRLNTRLLLANINHSMTEPDKAQDIALFGDMLLGTYVAGGCEIDNPISRNLWKRIGSQHLGGATETPVILSADWTVLAHKALVRTRGSATFDPPRKTFYSRLRHGSGVRLSLLVTHMDHEAFNGPAAGRLGRLAKWRSHLSKDRRLILRRRLAGDVVVHMGDLNAGGVVHYGRGQLVVHPEGEVMQITVLSPLRPRWRLRLGKETLSTGHTDHPLLCVPLTITKAA